MKLILWDTKNVGTLTEAIAKAIVKKEQPCN